MIDWRVTAFDEIKSTNDVTVEAAALGEAEGFVAWALSQTAGRGRLGRQWLSPRGNLYCSALLRPKSPPHEIARYSFVAALSLFDTIRENAPGSSVALKWPNDVLVNEKKISGILLEGQPDALIVGMGLNVQVTPQTSLYPSTCLCEAGGQVTELSSLLGRLLDHLDRWYGVFTREGFKPVRAAWLDRAYKSAYTIKTAGDAFQGVFKDLDAEGNLIVQLANGAERVISSGDILPIHENSNASSH